MNGMHLVEVMLRTEHLMGETQHLRSPNFSPAQAIVTCAAIALSREGWTPEQLRELIDKAVLIALRGTPGGKQ